MSDYNTLVIRNIDKNQKKLRPSDWVDRMATLAGTFEGGRLRYDSRAMPCRRCDDIICLRVDKSLNQEQPAVMETINEFMALNHLEDFVSQCPQHAEAYAAQQLESDVSRLTHSANENEMPVQEVAQGNSINGIQSAA